MEWLSSRRCLCECPLWMVGWVGVRVVEWAGGYFCQVSLL